MSSTKEICTCGAEGSKKYLNSSQHKNTARHKGIQKEAPTANEAKGKKHVEYVTHAVLFKHTRLPAWLSTTVEPLVGACVLVVLHLLACVVTFLFLWSV